MHINELGCDILHTVFVYVGERHAGFFGYKGKNYLIDASAVCRAWRALALPLLFESVYIANSDSSTKSNCEFILASGFAGYARALKLDFQCAHIDSIDLASTLNTAGVGQAVWPNIAKLDLSNSFVSRTDTQTVTGSVDCISKHFPNLKEIDCSLHVLNHQQQTEDAALPCNFLTDLAEKYSTRLQKLSLRLRDPLKGLSFPQALTHLSISLGKDESQFLARVYAPSLQCLRIYNAPWDIKWCWSDSSDDDGDVWFTSLKLLSVRFGQAGGTRLDPSNFHSNYDAGTKRVHFPALEALDVNDYFFTDDSFYKLFEHCPLKRIYNIESPKGADYQIPAKMLSRLSQLHTKIYLNDLQFSASRSEIPTKARKQGYDKAVANMLTSPSTVRSVYIASTETVVFTFPERLAWNLVERLQLQCFVDLQSIYAILAQMPKLKDFRFSLSASYLFNLRKNAGDGKKEAIERCRKANNRVEFIDIAIRKYSAVPRSSLAHCLSNLLPLVPSLLKLRINLDLVGVVREIIADPTNSLDWISPQLEVA